MTPSPHRALFSTLALAGFAIAQQPVFDVTDIVGVPDRSTWSDGSEVVRRAFHDIEHHDDNRPRPWHIVSGEGHSLPRHDDSEPMGLLSDEALTEALGLLGGSRGGDIRLERSGDGSFVLSDSPELVGIALEALRASLPPRIEVSLVLEQIDDTGSTMLLSGRQTFRNGETLTIADLETRPVVYDFEVEIAQAAATANPIVRSVTFGSSIVMRARPLPTADDVIIETVVRHATEQTVEPIEAHPAMGPLDRIASRFSEAGFSFRATRGTETVHEWSMNPGTRLRLTCGWSWEPRPAANGKAQVLCSNLFGPPVLGFRSTRGHESDEPQQATSVHDLVEHLAGTAPDSAIDHFERGAHGGGGVLIVSGESGPAFARALTARLERAFESRTLTVELLDVPQGAEIPATGPIAESQTLAMSSGPLLVDHPVCFAGGGEQSYLQDWEVEVAQSSRIPDPRVSIVEDGCFTTARASRSPTGRIESVELVVEIQRLVNLRQVPVSINSAMTALASVTDDNRSPSMWLPQDVVLIELPIERSYRLTAPIQLDENGAGILRRSAPRLLGGDRELVVRVQVK